MKYYGAPLETQLEVGKLLDLPLTENVQDWEFIYASPQIIEKSITLIQDTSLKITTRVAISCILIESLRDYYETNHIEHPFHAEALKAIHSSPDIVSAMHFFWIECSFGPSRAYLETLLGS